MPNDPDWLQALLGTFTRLRFAGGVVVSQAPGRVNVIGEHTDYNDGLVLPFAIGPEVRLVAAPRPDREVRIYSVNFGQEARFSLDDTGPVQENSWAKYIEGIARTLTAAGYLERGMHGVVDGTIPMAAGLSSSAAVEIAAGRALLSCNGRQLPNEELARLAQQAEHEHIHVRVGIMDQFVSLAGIADHALFLDCRSLRYEPLQLVHEEYVFLVTHSGQSGPLHSRLSTFQTPFEVLQPSGTAGGEEERSDVPSSPTSRGSANPKPRLDLAVVSADSDEAESTYNARRRECETAVERLKSVLPRISALRDVTRKDLERCRSCLDETLYRRALHVVSENTRVRRAAQAIRAADYALLGKLMNESHDSLRYNYEVSTDYLDTLVEAARSAPGCLGSRLTGAGLRGCTISLVRRSEIEAFKDAVSRRYWRSRGIFPAFFPVRPVAGATCELRPGRRGTSPTP